MPSLPDKPAGAEYLLEFSGSQRSLALDVAKLAVSSSSYSLPDFGGLCVCCEASTERRQATVPNSGGKVGSVELPVCSDCEAHAVAEVYQVPVYLGVAGVFLSMGGAAGWFVEGLGGHWIGLLAAGALVVGLGAWLARARQRDQRALDLDGHWPWLHVGAAVNLFRVRTRNPALARRLSESPLLSRVE